MKGAILVFGGTKSSREDTISKLCAKALELDTPDIEQIKHPDLLILKELPGKKSIGIDQSRELINFLYQKPFSAPGKVALIREAHKLTTAAQNALLKTLEEPPSYATIILEAKTESSLLPTVVSRCQRIDAKAQEVTPQQVGENSMEIILKSTHGDLLAWAERQAKKEREETIDILENWIIELESYLKKEPRYYKLIENITQVRNDLENTNVNLRLALEYLVLEMKRSGVS